MILFSNNASTSLAAACSESDAYIDVLPGTAVLFPVPTTNDDYFLVTAKNPSDGAVEIMKVTSVFGDRFNVVRAQEGTTAMAFPQNTIVENRLTAGSLEQLLNDIDATTDTPGRLRIATLAEALAGVVNNAVITPYTLRQTMSEFVDDFVDASDTPKEGSIPRAGKDGKLADGFLYYIGEFKSFFAKTPPKGWAVRDGGLLSKADVDYPDLWKYLTDPDNAWRTKTQAEWTALSNAAGGVGGVPFFVVDTTAKTIRLPDTRGDYTRDAGSTYLQSVGAWHKDEYKSHNHSTTTWRWAGDVQGWKISCDLSNQVFGTAYVNSSGGSETRTRSFSVLGCVYVRAI